MLEHRAHRDLAELLALQAELLDERAERLDRQAEVAERLKPLLPKCKGGDNRGP
jgi:hypothetical protein